MYKQLSAASAVAACVAFLLCFCAGVIGATHVRHVLDTGGDVSHSRSDALMEEAARVAQTNLVLEKRVAELTAESLLARARENELLLEAGRAREQAEAMAAKAGLTPVAGEGISIALEPLLGGGRAGNHAEDLLLLVNELRAAGAQAVTVNGERIGALTEIRVAGAYVNVNAHALAAPYTVCAVGDPATLESALRLPGGLFDLLQKTFAVTIEAQEHIEAGALP